MPSGYRSGGVDFDDLFDPYVQGTKPAATGRRVSGVDLIHRYAPIAYGTKRADVGNRVNGVDVSNLWAAKGTASYANADVVPDLYAYQVNSSAPVVATVSFYFNRDGSCSSSPQASSAWFSPVGGTPGDAYDIRFTQQGGSAGGSFSGTLNTWMQINQSRGCSLTVTRNQQGAISHWRQLLIEIRRRSDLVIVSSGSVTMTAEADIS